MRTQNSLLPKVHFIAALGLALAIGQATSGLAQDEGVVPASYQSGSFFDQKLGTALRFNYHTQGYGTQDDVFSLGGMKVFNMDGATVFVDGQGTLSDDFGGGFNLGVGYRQLTTTGMSIDPQRILGLGFWTDGQSTASDNFFTQLGFSLESLGDSFDMRLNGSFPLERTQASDAVLTGTGTPFFIGNNIFGATEELTIDTAHTVVDGEFAKRINDLEAWAFVGGYQLGGGGVDATGYRAGVRGYAVPDLALSLQVTDDDVYATNVMFGVTWFIGRTNKCNGPCGTLLDRFREPVLRNDFIATTSRRVQRASGNALTSQGTTDAIRLVHIDSNAGAGGDGTFENPFDEISDIDAIANPGNSLEGDILFVHSDANGADIDFTGASGMATLQDNQQLLGEGTDQNGNTIVHIVDTNELGNINLPETSTSTSTSAGSQALARVTIDGAGGDVFTLADNNTINNFTINNAATAVTASPDDLATDPLDTLATPTLQNLQINSPGTGVLLDRVSGTALVENTVEINGATATGLEVTGGESAMALAATINDSVGRSLSITGRTGGTIDYTGTIDDDAAGANTSLGVRIFGNTDATINLTNTLDIHVDTGADAFVIDSGNTNTIVNASGAVDLTAAGAGNTGRGLVIDGNSDDSTITFADLNATAADGDTVNIDDGGAVTISSADDTRTIANTGTGNAFFNSGGVVGGDNNAVVNVNSNITNAGGGRAVEIRDRAENDVTIAGTVTVENGSAEGVLIADNIDGNILFTNTLSLDTGANDAVVLRDNDDAATDATISFSDLDIDTTTGNGFTATGGGNLVVTSTNGTNDINVARTGVGVNLNDMTIDPANVTFDVVGVGTDAGFTGAGVGIDLQDLDGTGQVVIGGGTNAGDGGTLMTDGTAINVNNADNVAVTNVTVDNVGVAQGVNVTGQQTASSATFTGLDVTTANADAVSINGNDDGAVTFNTLTATTTGTGDGIDINNTDASTTAIVTNSVTVNANGTGRGYAATGGGTITMGGTNEINSAGDTAFDVDDVESLNASNVTINNTTAQGVNVSNQDAAADSVVLNNFDVTTTTAEAVRVASNSNGTVVLSGMTAESTSGDTVAIINNNNNATTSFNNLTATATTSGNAFSALNGGTLLATGTNNVSANTGRGVNIETTTIDPGNVVFANVNVTAGGNNNGIRLSTLTGGTVTVNSGNINTTTGEAILINNVSGATINNVTATTTTANAVNVTHTAATAMDVSMSNLTVTDGVRGVNVLANGAGEFDLTLNGAILTGVSAEGIAFDTGASAGRVDFTLTNSTVTVGDQNALLATLDDSNTADVRFVIDNNTLSNASGTADADLAAIDISVGSGLTASLRVGSLFAGEDPPAVTIGDNNVFTNSSADGDPLRISINDGGAGGVLNLDLRDNTAQSGTVQFQLTQTSGTFNLVDAVDTLDPNNENNVGDVIGAGAINTFAPPILAPTP